MMNTLARKKRRRSGSLWIDITYPEGFNLDYIAEQIASGIPVTVSFGRNEREPGTIEILSVYPPDGEE